MTAPFELIVPCRDEASALPTVLRRVPAGWPVLVVDNGSRDDTADVARRHGARVVQEIKPGYGAAVHAGVLASRADILLVMDGDGSVDAPDVLPLLTAVMSGQCRLALGRRRPVDGGKVPRPAAMGNRLVVLWLQHQGLHVSDVSPVRACWRADLLSLNVRDRRFGYPVELLARAARQGWSLREYPVPYRPRCTGTRSKVSGSLRGSLLAAHDIVRVVLS